MSLTLTVQQNLFSTILRKQHIFFNGTLVDPCQKKLFHKRSGVGFVNSINTKLCGETFRIQEVKMLQVQNLPKPISSSGQLLLMLMSKASSYFTIQITMTEESTRCGY